MVLNRGLFCPCREFWQCLETFWIATIGRGEAVAGLYWVGAGVLRQETNQPQTSAELRIHLPGKDSPFQYQPPCRLCGLTCKTDCERERETGREQGGVGRECGEKFGVREERRGRRHLLLARSELGASQLASSVQKSSESQSHWGRWVWGSEGALRLASGNASLNRQGEQGWTNGPRTPSPALLQKPCLLRAVTLQNWALPPVQGRRGLP